MTDFNVISKSKLILFDSKKSESILSLSLFAIVNNLNLFSIYVNYKQLIIIYLTNLSQSIKM